MHLLPLLFTSLILLNSSPFYSPANIDKTMLDCFYGYADSTATHLETEIQIQSEGVKLAGRLFMPHTAGPHPAVVLIHGGGSNVDRLRSTPLYFAPRLARCGLAVLVYDKRGTGDSGGDYESSTFDDFVNDAGNGVLFLSNHKMIDKERIGVLGFSQGGRLAPVVAVRYPALSFAASVSGPLTSVEDTRLYALENSFQQSGVSEARLSQVMPLWRKHFAALAGHDQPALNALDVELESLTGTMHPALIPPLSDSLPRTGIYNSIGRDYTTELSQLTVPWFSLYGEEDIVVPVKKSVAILHERMEAGTHKDYEVIIVPSATHSFVDTNDGTTIKFEAMVLDWMLKRVR